MSNLHSKYMSVRGNNKAKLKLAAAPSSGWYFQVNDREKGKREESAGLTMKMWV